MEKKVLIGSAGSSTAFNAVCSLRRLPDCNIHVACMDTNPAHLVTASLLADRFFQVSRFDNQQFGPELLKIMHAECIDTYLPLYPYEIEIAANLASSGRFPERVTLIAPSENSAKLCANKRRLADVLKQNYLPTPELFTKVDNLCEKQYFVKPINGVGSFNATVVDADILKTWEEQELSKYVIQEICSGPEVTVDGFRNIHKRNGHYVCRERLVTKAGVSIKCRLFYDEELSDLVHKCAEVLGLYGAFCIQVMKANKAWVITDVNPRPGSATTMCMLTGNDFYSAHFLQAWGCDTEACFKTLDREVFVTRQYADFLMGSE